MKYPFCIAIIKKCLVIIANSKILLKQPDLHSKRELPNLELHINYRIGQTSSFPSFTLKTYMRKLILFSLAGLFFCSCQFNEKLVLNENGSGNYTYSFDIDAGSMLKGLDTSKAEKTESIEKGKAISYTGKTYQTYVDENFAKSVVKSNKELFEKYEKLIENYTVKVSEEGDDKSSTSFSIDFKQPSEIVDGNKIFFYHMMLEDAKKGKSTFKDKVGKRDNVVNYFNSKFDYKNNVFSRNIEFKAEEKDKKQSEKDKELMESMSSMLKYKTTYVFPKRIKKVNNEKATFSLDGKTMNIEYGFFDIIANPEILKCVVEFE